ncbi:ABC transporter permease subunit, partial [Patescibacteria group bacterium]|nr:ABC transporter permease subunit [Patescibacteria group bacterium]
MEFDFWSIVLSKTWFSTWESVITVVLSLGVGGGLAILEYFLRIKRSKIFTGLMVLPIFLPGIVVATGFIVVWGNAGLINDLLKVLGVEQVKFLYSAGAIIAGNCFYNIPLAYLALSSKLANMHYYLEDQAKVMGASNIKTLLKITWPRIKNVVIGVGIIIFLYSFLSFALPLVLGGIKYQTLEVYIYSLITQQLDLKAALILAGLQFVGLLALILLLSGYLTNQSEKYFNISKDNNFKNSIFIFTVRILVLIFILLPIGGVLFKGLGDIINLNSTTYWMGLFNSFWLALCSGAISLGLVFILMNTKKDLGKWSLVFLAISPIALGAGLLYLFGDSVLGMLLAYIFLSFPINYFLVSSFWKSRPAFFIESIKLLGADWKDEIKIISSYLSTTILKALAISIVFVMGDIAIVSVLAPYKFKTAMSLSYSYLGA